MFMNIPNKITLTRICLMPLFILFSLLTFTGSKFIALFIFIIAAISDALDGHIARKYNLITDLGKFLDPIADKLLASTGLVMLIVGTNPIIPMPYGIVVIFIMLLRDYEVTGIRQIGQLKGKIIAADKVAKIKANFLYSTLVYGLLISALRDMSSVAGTEFLKYFTFVFYIFVGITTCLIALSGIVYFVNNFSVFKDIPNDNITKECKVNASNSANNENQAETYMNTSNEIKTNKSKIEKVSTKNQTKKLNKK